MIIWYTTDDFIDPSGKHILTREAFNAWADITDPTVWHERIIADFSFTKDPIPVTLPYNAKYLITSIADGYEQDTFTGRFCYFCRPRPNFSPYWSAAENSFVATFDLILDVMHTFPLFTSGNTSAWTVLGSSVLFRSPTLINEYTTIFDKSSYERMSNAGIQILDTQPSQYCCVILFIEKLETDLLTNAFHYRPYFVSTDNKSIHDMIVQLKNALMAVKVTGILPNPSTTVSICASRAFIFPLEYLPSYITSDVDLVALYDNNDNFLLNMNRLKTDDHHRYRYRVIPSSDIDPRNYHYRVGVGNMMCDLDSCQYTIIEPISVQTHIGIASGFSMYMSINGRQYDITDSCAVPFSIVNEAEVAATNTQRQLNSATAGISAAVGIAGGIAAENPAMVLGGVAAGINAVSGLIQSPSNVPITSASGSLFAQLAGGVTGLIRYEELRNDEVTRQKNLIYGGRNTLSVSNTYFRGVISAMGTDSMIATKHSLYFEGDIHLTSDNPFGFSVRDDLERHLAEGVHVWDDASFYRGNYFAT